MQCLTGNYRTGLNEYEVDFLDYVLRAEAEQRMVRHGTLQSEEGGRFFQEQNKHIIIEADDYFPIEISDRFIWMTLDQLHIFLKFNNYLNIQTRSLLSLLQFT